MLTYLKNNLREPDTHAALILSIVAVNLWQGLHPRLTDEEAHYLIGPFPRALAERFDEPLETVDNPYYENVSLKRRVPSFETGGTIHVQCAGYYTFEGT